PSDFLPAVFNVGIDPELKGYVPPFVRVVAPRHLSQCLAVRGVQYQALTQPMEIGYESSFGTFPWRGYFFLFYVEELSIYGIWSILFLQILGITDIRSE